MAILTPEQWLANKATGNVSTVVKSTGIQTPEQWLASRPMVEKKPTLTGKVLGVGKALVHGLVEPVATMLARPIQAGAELAGASAEQVDAATKRIAGDWVAPVPKSYADVPADIGRAIQTVALGIPGSNIEKAVAGKLGMATLSASKLTPAALKLAETVSRVGTNVGTGAIFGAGIGIQQNEGIGNTLKQTAIGGVLGGALPEVIGGVGKLFGKGASKLSQVVPTVENTVVKEAIPTAEQISTGVSQKAGGYQFKDLVNHLNARGYTNEQVGEIIGKLDQNNPGVARYNQGQIESVVKDIQPKNPTTFVKPEGYGVTSDVKTTSQAIPKIGTPIAETPNIAQQTPTNATQVAPEITARAEDIATKMAKDSPVALTEFEHQTNIKQIETVMTKDSQHIMDVAMGRVPSQDVPNTAYLAVADKMANDLANKGDYSLASELSKSNVGRQAGQNLQALTIAAKDSIVGIIRNVRVAMEDALPDMVKRNKVSAVEKIKSNITKTIDDLGVLPTRQVVIDALEKIKCK